MTNIVPQHFVFNILKVCLSPLSFIFISSQTGLACADRPYCDVPLICFQRQKQVSENAKRKNPCISGSDSCLKKDCWQHCITMDLDHKQP